MLQVLRSFFSLVVPILLIAVHFAVMLCFINRWDTVVTVTLVPIWMWAAVAVIAGFPLTLNQKQKEPDYNKEDVMMSL